MLTEHLGESDLNRGELFWKQLLQGMTSGTSLGIDRSLSARPTGNPEFRTQSVHLSEPSSLCLDFLKEHQIDPQLLLIGAWSILLSQYSNEKDVVFCVQDTLPCQNTEKSGFNHFLPMRVQVEPDKLLFDWLEQLQAQWLALQVHKTTLSQIYEWSGFSTEQSLVESLLLLPVNTQNSAFATQPFGTLDVPEWSNYPLIVQADISSFTVQFQYDCTIFEEASITRLLGHLKTLLEGMVANFNQQLVDLSILPIVGQEQLLAVWQGTPNEPFQVHCLHHQFEKRAEQTPYAIAVVFEHQTLTYQQLNQKANRIAHYLQSLGIGVESRVGIYVERSLDWAIGILAILKSGAGYVPLDPMYPSDRLDYILKDAEISVLLTQTQLVDQLPNQGCTLVDLEQLETSIDQYPAHNPTSDVTVENLAYVIYTSGSTGLPKGVLVTHANVARLFTATYAWYGFDQQDVWTLFHSCAFDFSVWELWGALLYGGKLVVVPYAISRDPQAFYQLLRQEQVTVLNQTPSAFRQLIHTEASVGSPGDLKLRYVIFGGEALELQSLRSWFERHGDRQPQLVNMYGITETTVHVTYRPISLADLEGTASLIGCPIPDLQLYLLDQNQRPVPIGVPGELYVGGKGVARGYLNRPELTAERFIPNPFDESLTARLYKTGDLARYLPTGEFEYLGRIDFQVKIRGYRIELGEIEAVLAKHPLVQETVVLAREDQSGEKRLVAYIVPTQPHSSLVTEVRRSLEEALPAYMVPAVFVVLEALPLTINGKVDQRSLPVPSAARPQLEQAFVAPQTAQEKQLSNLWCNLLRLEQVGIYDNFFELGGTSLSGAQMIERLQQQSGTTIRVVKLYQHPTIFDLARYLTEEATKQQTYERIRARYHEKSDIPGASETISGSSPSLSLDGVAIVGMAGRFPGATSVEEFWQNVCAGVESTTFFTDAEMDASIDPALRSDPSYVPAKGVLAGAETFDAAFFGISPREAEVMDPQSRVFLELAHTALENAGYSPDAYKGLIGLYAGCGENTYFANHLCGRQEIIDRLGSFQTMLANEKDFLTTRTSYKLNLRGPSISINTACSTSLVAVIQAFQGLMSGQCDLALAGGISITTPQNQGYLYQEGAMLSPDGRCRPFDASAQGTLFNNGAGIVVLKRLKDAIREGDRIYAAIRGVGINNDGAGKVSFTAPSVDGQAEAILTAQVSANFHPETISYIEAHGTATPLGDPIEVEALTQAFRMQTEATQFCAIGSVKSNVGHLVAAAGVAGLIKTALALYHRKLPPSLNFQAPNPEIDFANSPFYVNAQLTDWQCGTNPRRAGVSSFGVGGTNAHIVLEELPELRCDNPSRPQQLLIVSAKTSAALEQATINLKQHLQQHPDLNLADVAYTLQQGRRAFNHRRAIICRDATDAITALEPLEPKQVFTRYTDRRNSEVVFMFPGQGSQYVNMGHSLYQHEPVFRAEIDRCAEFLHPLLEKDLREVIYLAAGDSEVAAALLQQTVYTQPALFAVEYALAMLWQSWGIRPSALIGHSIGEFVAACLAGVFSLESALKLIATRARLMWELPPGSMISVRLPAAEVEKRLGEELAIAAINGPALCVVSGPTSSIIQLQEELTKAEVVCKSLHTSHAFHSPMMDGIVEPFASLVRSIPLRAPRIPFVSTVTADWITDEQATDPMYWAQHLRATVRFAEGVQTLWQQPERILLEVGPRITAATLARQQARDLKQQIAISSLGSTAEDGAEWNALTQAIGQLWLAGVAIDWQVFYAHEKRYRVPLPTYPFERQRYWIDPQPKASNSTPVSSVQPALAVEVNSNIPAPMTQPNSVTQPPSLTREQSLVPVLKNVLEIASGLDLAEVDTDTTFLEMGLDSLSLTQVALAMKKQFKVKITFRYLLEDYTTLGALAAFLDRTLPADSFAVPQPETLSPDPIPVMSDFSASEAQSIVTSNGSQPILPMLPTSQLAPTGAIETLVAQQLQLMAQQLELLRQTGGTQPAIAPTPLPATPTTAAPKKLATEVPKLAKMHGPGAKIEKSSSNALTSEQRSHLEQLINRYTSRTQTSKQQTQEHRPYLADPRTVSGFCPLLKEMVYPIVVERSSGSKLWDVDGNEYIDLTNGFGLNFFGWNPDFVREAVIAQLDKGIEIGPQTPLAGRVAKLITEFTGMKRVAFCNTGSEAVMAALRLARTVTGRDTIAIFSGAYHGTFDEVIVRSGSNLRSLPGAPGIMSSMFDNILVLEYGTPESLEILRNRADDLAAIMVEPVQSRHPGLQPKEFLHELRHLTQQSGTAFIVDEVVTGFRVHPGGAQAYFGIQADLATYGKVVGGGLPIGVLAGKAEYMDALDGGEWQFGDSSIPEVGVTFFAGTFVRHPMALAAAEAVLHRLKAAGPELQVTLSAKVNRFVTQLKQHLERVGVPLQIEHFSSFFYITYPPDLTYGNLLFYLLREKGIHIWENRPCFFTLSHTDENIEQVTRAFKDSIAELQAAGFLSGATAQLAASNLSNGNDKRDRNHPPQLGARLGRDPHGKPAWFIPDPARPGKYLQAGEAL